MSLAASWDSILGVTCSLPQNTYVAQLPPAKYQLTYAYTVNRSYWRFSEPVIVNFDCAFASQPFRISFNEKPPGGSSLDPILFVTGFVVTCPYAGTYLGTSRWFNLVGLTLQFGGGAVLAVDWVHFMNYSDNVGSVGLKTVAAVPA